MASKGRPPTNTLPGSTNRFVPRRPAVATRSRFRSDKIESRLLPPCECSFITQPFIEEHDGDDEYDDDADVDAVVLL